MKINTAADLASVLDPEHKVDGWWKIESSNRRSDCTTNWYTYIGPPDLHTAREHAWRMGEWLEERDCLWTRKYNRAEMINETQVTLIGKRGEVLLEFWSDNHTAALVAAIERVSE